LPFAFIQQALLIEPIRKTDGWFLSVRIENPGIPNIYVITNGEIKIITGGVLGLGKVVYL
jgi:hypothetical protein